MPQPPIFPGVFVPETPDGIRPITGVPTSITLFIGWAAKGPIDEASRIHSFADFEREYGGLDGRSRLGHCVRHFFDNGGTDAYVLRLAGEDGVVLDPGDDAVAVTIPPLFDVGGPIDRIDLFNLVCVPGLTLASEVSKLAAKCARRRAFLIVDCPEDATRNDVENALTGMIGSGASNTGFYFPWVLAPDPLAGGAVTPYPPCGFVAGVFARTDARRGVWKAPAGQEASLNGASGMQDALGSADIEALNVSAINCLRALPSHVNAIWGARTLEGTNNRNSEWKYVPVRRLALYIEESLYRGTQWAVFEPNDETLWSRLRLNIDTFFHGLFRQGAFQGTKPSDAWFVRCDHSTTSQADIDRGIVNIHLGFAPLRPAEFIVLRLQQSAGQSTS